jgi:hypothetical protein
LIRNASLLAVTSITIALLGLLCTLALVIHRIVLPQALWIASPFLELAVIGFLFRKNASAACITLIGTTFLVMGGFFAFLVEERTWAVSFVPALLWCGCALLLLILFVRWLLGPHE